jgi:hypothetical protein
MLVIELLSWSASTGFCHAIAKITTMRWMEGCIKRVVIGRNNINHITMPAPTPNNELLYGTSIKERIFSHLIPIAPIAIPHSMPTSK